jgi:hypothetical protein
LATLTVNTVSLAGFRDDNALVAAAGGGDAFAPGADTFFRINNGGGAPITVTFTTPATIGGIAIDNPAVVVTNAQSRLIGPFPYELFADPTTGLCVVTYSGVTTVTVAAFKLPRA